MVGWPLGYALATGWHILPGGLRLVRWKRLLEGCGGSWDYLTLGSGRGQPVRAREPGGLAARFEGQPAAAINVRSRAHETRAHLLVVDDHAKNAEEAASATIRERTWELVPLHRAPLPYGRRP